jgi:23S rRNA (uracil1939-C5)-methyltransferase
VELEAELNTSADRFAQASESGNKALVAAVDRAVTPRKQARILELFAGQGNFTHVLARDAARVVAVDVAPGSGGERIEWRSGRAEEVTAKLLRAGERFDWAVLDPPRTGARELVAPLAELAPTHILYVSCDPASLARDLEALVERGYRAVRALVFDLMPQTAHLELLAVLTVHHWPVSGRNQ